MYKRALDIPLLGSALGAGGGLLYAKNSSKPFGMSALNGALIGAGLGFKTEFISQAIRSLLFKRRLNQLKNNTNKDLQRVVKTFGDIKIPVYLQTAGTPFDNAMYIEGQPQWMFMPDKPVFKNLLTGKRVNKTKDRAVYLGRNFRKLPILAHELGHASDFKDKPNLERIALYAGRGLSGVGLLASFGLLAAGASGKIAKDKLLPLLGISAGVSVLGNSMNKSLTQRSERRASDAAIQVLNKIQKPDALTTSKDLLNSAYATYDPIMLHKPEFGLGEYYSL